MFWSEAHEIACRESKSSSEKVYVVKRTLEGFFVERSPAAIDKIVAYYERGVCSFVKI